MVAKIGRHDGVGVSLPIQPWADASSDVPQSTVVLRLSVDCRLTCSAARAKSMTTGVAGLRGAGRGAFGGLTAAAGGNKGGFCAVTCSTGRTGLGAGSVGSGGCAGGPASGSGTARGPSVPVDSEVSIAWRAAPRARDMRLSALLAVQGSSATSRGPVPGSGLGFEDPNEADGSSCSHSGGSCGSLTDVLFAIGGRYAVFMHIAVLTMFPEYFRSPLDTSLVEKARRLEHLTVEVVDLRAYGTGPHRQLDDAPFGGGAGMVMAPGPLAEALDPLEGTHRVLLTPAGRPLDQATLDRLAEFESLTLVCGRYEGVDERIAEHFIDEEISIGDYVLLGGEVAALVIIEGVVRLLPGVVGNPASIANESFRDGLLEEPQYTRPAEFRGLKVPEVLLSGNHQKVAEWRQRQRLRRTMQRRPDLAADFPDSEDDD